MNNATVKFVIRLVTTFCYFLPFSFFLSTCNGITLDFAYNKKEAEKNSKQSTREPSLPTVDTLRIDTLKNEHKKSSDSTLNPVNIKDWILQKLITPTENSLSAFGCIFYYKNLTGQIAIAFSFLVSLVLLLTGKFLKPEKLKRYLQLGNILSIVIFIIDSFISEVTLLWGTWTLLVILLIQLKLETNKA